MLLWYWGRRGGGAHYTAALAEALAARGDVVVSASVSSEFSCLARVRRVVEQCELVPLRRTAPLRLLVGLRRLSPAAAARRQRADVVLHTMVHPLTPYGMRALRRAGIPVVFVLHDGRPHPGDRHRLVDAAARDAVRHADRVVVASDHVAEQARAMAPRTPVDVVPLGPHLEFDDLWDPSGPVVFFGRLLAYKGLDLLASAWPAVAGLDGARLRVVGEPRGSVPELALLRRLGADVREGWVPDDAVAQAIGGARLVVLPYREGSQSGVVTLAASAGIPVLATDVGGLASQVGDGGLVVAPDAGALSDALHRLLSHPGEVAALRAKLLERRDNAAAWQPLAARLVDVARAASGR